MKIIVKDKEQTVQCFEPGDVFVHKHSEIVLLWVVDRFNNHDLVPISYKHPLNFKFGEKWTIRKIRAELDMMMSDDWVYYSKHEYTLQLAPHVNGGAC